MDKIIRELSAAEAADDEITAAKLLRRLEKEYGKAVRRGRLSQEDILYYESEIQYHRNYFWNGNGWDGGKHSKRRPPVLLLCISGAVILIAGICGALLIRHAAVRKQAAGSQTAGSEVATGDASATVTLPAEDEPSDSVEGSDGNADRSEIPDIKPLEIHFIDVGQGDATLLICDGEAMLIDAGDNSKGTTVQLYLKKHDVTELKYIAGTHPDADHIGGLDVIITKYDIGLGEVWMPNKENDTATYRDVMDAIDYRGYTSRCPAVGETFMLGTAVITVLGPRVLYEDNNNSSLVFLVQNGEYSALFTGDAAQEAEEAMIMAGESGNLHAQILKIGHHGSRTSTSDAFLDAVNPLYAVISVGEANKYGHPTAECLNRLRERGIQVFRTDEQGSVTVIIDSTGITFNCAPSDSWQAGEASESDKE